MPNLVLHGYWRSGTSYRTRIALNAKRLDYRQAPVDLLSGEQRAADYRALNPLGLVPTLEADGRLRRAGGHDRRHGGRYAFGDSLTMADCHLVP